MNISVYLFGQLGDKYTQYPTDYTQSYFQEFERSVKAQTAIGIRRNGDLMLYQYIRRLSAGKSTQGEYIGIAIVYNGIMLTDLEPLFQIFEDTITNLVVSGKILQFTNNGDITSDVSKLYQASSEFERVSEYLSAQLNTTQSIRFEKLPPKNYAVSEDQSKSFSIQDDMADIIEATRNYTKVYVLKKTGYNSTALTSYSAKLRKLTEARDLAQKTIIEQGRKITALERRQKNFRLVLLLMAVILIGIIVARIYVNNTNTHIDHLVTNIEELNTDNETKQQIIEQQRDSIGSLLQKNHQQSIEITELTQKSEQLNADLDQTTQQLSVANSKIKQLENENKTQKSTITALQNRLNSTSASENTSSSTSYSSTTSYSNSIVGANINNVTTTNFDANYVLWLYAKKSVRINSFYVKSDKTGYITIGLYNANHTLISSQKVYLTKGVVTKITPAFSITTSGKYYLAIVENNGINLSYHKSSSSEFEKYKSGDLQIIGTSSKGQRNANTNYYQYFYYISYSAL